MKQTRQTPEQKLKKTLKDLKCSRRSMILPQKMMNISFVLKKTEDQMKGIDSRLSILEEKQQKMDSFTERIKTIEGKLLHSNEKCSYAR